jgi:rare lipoprotein A
MRDTLVCLVMACALVIPAAVSPAAVTSREVPTTLVYGPPVPETPAQIGRASFYHPLFDGRKTASGALFDSRLLTAAHRTLQFGTRVRVTNLVNLKSVVVTINDRGPYVPGRIIDLSRYAAAKLGFVQKGVTRVRVEPIAVAATL